jgi:hypothetical protein
VVANSFEMTHAIITQICTFINSKLKFNGMNGVEGKFKNRTLRQGTKGCGTQSLGELVATRPATSLPML